MKDRVKRILCMDLKDIIKNKTFKVSLVVVLVTSILVLIYSAFFAPTKLNKFVAYKLYKEPASSAFTDQNFYNCVVDSYNRKNRTSLPYTTNLTDEQLQEIEEVSCSGYQKTQSELIVSTTGLEKLTSLKKLNLSNNRITEIDLSNNESLIELSLRNNDLEEIDLSQNTNLQNLDLYSSIYLGQVNLSNNTALTELNLSSNRLGEIDLSANTALTSLYLEHNDLEEIDLSQNINLQVLSLNTNYLTTVDLSNHTNLKRLKIVSNNLNSINLLNDTALTYLDLSVNDLTEIDLSTNTALQDLYLTHNDLTGINLSNNLDLYSVYLSSNEISWINVTNNVNLRYLWVDYNNLTEIDVSSNTDLRDLHLTKNQLTEIDVSSNTGLNTLVLDYNKLTGIDLNNNTSLGTLSLSNNQLSEIDVSKNVSLSSLYLSNNQLSEIDVSKNVSLRYLSLSNNQLSEIDISKNESLLSLYLSENELTEIDVSKNTSLVDLDLSGNKLTEVDVTKNLSLEEFDISYNNISEIDISKNLSLTKLNVSNTNLSEIDVSKHLSLTELNVSNTNLSEIDVSNNPNLTKLAYSTNLMVGQTVSVEQLLKSIKFHDSVIIDEPQFDCDYSDVFEIVDHNTKLKINNAGEGSIRIEDVGSFYEINLYVNAILDFSVSSDYTIKDDTIYVGRDVLVESILNKVSTNVSDFEIRIVDGNDNVLSSGNIDESSRLQIVSYGDVVREYNFAFYQTNLSDFTDEYYLYGVKNGEYDDSIFSNGITTSSNIEIRREEDKLNMYYKADDYLLDTWDIISYSSTNYDLSNGYIFVEGEFEPALINNSYGEFDVNDTKVELKYQNQVIKQWDLLKFSFSKYLVKDGYVYIGNDEVIKSEFVTNFYSNSTNLSIDYPYEHFLEGDRFRIYNDSYNFEREYTISLEYIDLSELDIAGNVIKGIEISTTYNDIKEKIRTSGNIHLYDKDDNLVTENRVLKTGDKIKIQLSNHIEEYVVSVSGDINGTGYIDIGDLTALLFDLMDIEKITGECYILAADYNNTGYIDIGDLTKVLYALMGGEE